VALNTKIQ